MTMARKLITIFAALAIAALLLSSCGVSDRPAQQSAAPAAAAPTAAPHAAPAQPPPTALPEELYIRADDGSESGILAILGGKGVRELPLGAVAPDWSTLYTVATRTDYGPPKTFLRALDLKTGTLLRETTLDGAYALPAVSLDGMLGGLSPNGDWLVLRKAPGQTIGRLQSQFVVLDTAFARPPRRVDLDVDGPYEFDGISSDGASLYLVQYLSSPSLAQATKYHVRYYNLAQGALDPQPVVAKGEEAVMAGTHHTSVAAPGGMWRYSLYMNNSYGPFIHALNLTGRFALCIDLPKAGKDDAERQMFWSMAVSPDGKTLYAVNGALGLVTELNISQDGLPEIRRTAALPTTPAASAGPLDALAALFAAPVAEAKPEHGRGALGAATVSADGKTLFALGQRGLLAIDTRDLSLRERYLQDTALGSLALSADGARLYAVSLEEGQIVRLDTATGKLLGEVASARRPWGVLRVAVGR
jgi:outer membrane protein assembly factor BamB